MKISIAPISESDYEGVLSIWNHELGNSMVNKNHISTFYDDADKDERYQTFSARGDHQVLGFITSVHSLAVGLGNGFVHINGLAVIESHQGKGFGQQLLQRLEQYAKEIGVTSLIANSGKNRTEAPRFYEKNGFDKDSYCLDKQL